MLTITREFGFDMGHCLPDHKGGCYRPHGHRYRLEVQLAGERNVQGAERGMVMDYGRLKQVVEQHVISQLDHRFIMAADDPRLDMMRATFDDGDVLVSSGPPTAEALAEHIAVTLAEVLPELVEVTLWETPTCRATYRV